MVLLRIFSDSLQSWLPWTIYLQIGRLTDPAQSGSKDGLRSNASFAGFVQVLREAGETAAADALDEDFKAMKPALDKDSRGPKPYVGTRGSADGPP